MAASSPGSQRWPTSGWPALLRDARSLIEGLDREPAWSFGGGTALAVHYGHRVSYDVDVFLSDADVLTALSPNANPATRTLLDGRKYEFPGNYLKLKLESGEIDFILAGRRTARATAAWTFEGREIALETPVEIAIKKLFHRPSTFKVRDIFDLAAVIERDAEELGRNLHLVADRLAKVNDRIDAIIPRYEALAELEVNATPAGGNYARRSAADSVLTFLRRAL